MTRDKLKPFDPNDKYALKNKNALLAEAFNRAIAESTKSTSPSNLTNDQAVEQSNSSKRKRTNTESDDSKLNEPKKSDSKSTTRRKSSCLSVSLPVIDPLLNEIKPEKKTFIEEASVVSSTETSEEKKDSLIEKMIDLSGRRTQRTSFLAASQALKQPAKNPTPRQTQLKKIAALSNDQRNAIKEKVKLN